MPVGDVRDLRSRRGTPPPLLDDELVLTAEPRTARTVCGRPRRRGTGRASHSYDAVAAVPLLLADGAHRYVYGAGTVPLAQVSDEVQYLHGDLIGSVRTVTDAGGAPVADFRLRRVRRGACSVGCGGVGGDAVRVRRVVHRPHGARVPAAPVLRPDDRPVPEHRPAGRRHARRVRVRRRQPAAVRRPPGPCVVGSVDRQQRRVARQTMRCNLSARASSTRGSTRTTWSTSSPVAVAVAVAVEASRRSGTPTVTTTSTGGPTLPER